MNNPADLDTAFLVPCKHCDALLQERDRICPYCGEDQSVANDARDARSLFELGPEPEPIPERPTDADAYPEDEALALVAANEDLTSEIGPLRPGAFWQKEVLGIRGARHWASSAIAPSRLVVNIAIALALVALALVVDHIYLDQRSEAGKQQEFGANVERVQSALSRGDLIAAELVLDVLAADHADDPGVQTLMKTFDLRVQEQTAKREQLRAAAERASKALGFTAAPPSLAPSPPEPPVVARPAPSTCDEALAALALCSK